MWSSIENNTPDVSLGVSGFIAFIDGIGDGGRSYMQWDLSPQVVVLSLHLATPASGAQRMELDTSGIRKVNPC